MTDLRPEEERLASRLDQALPPGMTRTPRETTDVLVNTALLLARTQVSPLSAEADARIQKRVLAAMRTQKQPRRRSMPVFARWLAAACLVVVVLAVGLVPLSAESLPGELLYPVKRGLEQVELLLVQNPEERALVNLTQAERRLDEQMRLVEAGRFEPALLQSALRSLSASANAVSASNNTELLRSLERRSAVVTLRFSALMENQTGQPTPPDAGNALQPGTEEATSDVVLLSPEPSATAISTPRNTVVRQLPVPPGLATRLAPVGAIIATRAAEPTATCAAGRSCQSSGLPGTVQSTAVPGASGGGSANGNSNGNANGNSNGSSTGSSNGNSTGNGNANGLSNGTANGTGNAGGNSDGSANGNSGGNSTGAANGNSGDNGNGSANGAAVGTGNGNSNGADGGNGNANGNADNSNGSAGGNANGNSESSNGSASGNANGNSDSSNGNANGNSDSSNGNANGNSDSSNGNANGNNSAGSGSGSSDDSGDSNGNSNGNSGGNGNGNGNANGNSGS